MTGIRRPLGPQYFSPAASGRLKGSRSKGRPANDPLALAISYPRKAVAKKPAHSSENTTNCGVCDTPLCTCTSTETRRFHASTLRRWNVPLVELGYLARTFYGALALGMRYPEFRPQRDRIAHDTAHTVYRGLILACAAEARYDVQFAVRGLRAERLRRHPAGPAVLNLPIYRSAWFQHYSRSFPAGFSRESAVLPPPNQADLYSEGYPRLLRNIFLWSGRFAHGNAPTGYGGLLWAACAQIGLDWRAGRSSDIEFVDRAFDSRHNNAPALSKAFNTAYGLDSWLTMRAIASLDWLLRWAPNTLRMICGLPAVVPIPMKRMFVNILDPDYLPAVLPDDTLVLGSKATIGTSSGGIARGGSPALVTAMLAPLGQRAIQTFSGLRCACTHACRTSLEAEHDCVNLCTPECACSSNR